MKHVYYLLIINSFITLGTLTTFGSSQVLFLKLDCNCHLNIYSSIVFAASYQVTMVTSQDDSHYCDTVNSALLLATTQEQFSTCCDP